MAERTLFGTDGIRGVANVAPMTGEVAMALGRAVTYHVARKTGKAHPRIVVGKDTRLSGYMIETALASGICSMGGKVLLVGPLPTPGISFITTSMRADAGVVISASHNPYSDNGIKLFDAEGFKLPDEEELALERLIRDGVPQEAVPTADGIGKAQRVDDATGRYIVELKHTFPKDLTLDGLKVVVDCAHGAAYKVAPAVLSELGAEVVPLGVAPDGVNINRECGALYPNKAAIAVLEHGAHVGIALDGDADRVILVDERGQVVDGDAVMALCAAAMIAQGTLRHGTLVTTVMSNIGLDKAVQRAGGRVVRTAVGDRYVVEAMRTHGYNLGGEQSGHLIFADHATTGDGVLAALQILAQMVRTGASLSDLAGGAMERVPQAQLSFAVPRKPPIAELDTVQACVDEIAAALGDDGRVLVRYSGTEPKARVLVEGPDKQRIEEYAHRIKDALLEALA